MLGNDLNQSPPDYPSAIRLNSELIGLNSLKFIYKNNNNHLYYLNILDFPISIIEIIIASIYGKPLIYSLNKHTI
jgi:hypothetical protein